MNKGKVFTAYCRSKYRVLWTATCLTLQSLYGLKGGGMLTMYDHGLLWKLGRDLWVLAATLVRILAGVAVLTTMTLATPVAAIARAIFIPIVAAFATLTISRTINKAKRQFLGLRFPRPGDKPPTDSGKDPASTP